MASSEPVSGVRILGVMLPERRKKTSALGPGKVLRGGTRVSSSGTNHRMTTGTVLVWALTTPKLGPHGAYEVRRGHVGIPLGTGSS